MTVNIENFTDNELQCKCGCGLLNISNEALISLQAFRYYLNRVFKRDVKLIVNSGCRCIDHNKSVGGSISSEHEGTTKQSTAFDLRSPDINNQQLYYSACRSSLFSTIIKYRGKGFTHVDTRQRNNYEIKNWII